MSMYNVIADENELKWFFDNVIQKPKVNESYSAVFVSRHKKLTKEEQETIGLTRKESEFLSTVTFKLRNMKDAQDVGKDITWTFENFLKTLRRFNVDKYAYTTSLGEPLPEKTLAVMFYTNPCDDMKVCKKFVEEYNSTTETIAKASLNGKPIEETMQLYQWFGKAESTIKHFKANCKGSRYWLDYDIDVPKWFKGVGNVGRNNKAFDYQTLLFNLFTDTFGKGNYVVVDTSGGYHILVKASVIKSNPHDICKKVKDIYNIGLIQGEEPYLDEKGNCKFECVVNDSQIPGVPLPGTYQYGRVVRVVNKEDFE